MSGAGEHHLTDAVDAGDAIAGHDAVDPDEQAVAAARAGDETAFTLLVERHHKELRVHCYRMLGSLDESEDLVQETFLRAWNNIDGFEGRSSVRAWLYRIATNACLDVLRGRARRVLPHQLSGPWRASDGRPPLTDVGWLQPFPDRLLPEWEPVAPSEKQPDNVVVDRETMELALLAAIQFLPPRQRAALVLRDLLGWPATETAAALDASVASVNSALQRARATLKQRLPRRRLDWAPSAEPSVAEQDLLRRYLDAVERADLDAMAELVAADVRATMPPYPMWFEGRETFLASLAASWDIRSAHFVGHFRMVPTRANGQPSAAAYVGPVGSPTYSAFAIGVLRVEGDHITELTAFHDPGLFPAFGLPMTLPARDR